MLFKRINDTTSIAINSIESIEAIDQLSCEITLRSGAKHVSMLPFETLSSLLENLQGPTSGCKVGR